MWFVLFSPFISYTVMCHLMKGIRCKEVLPEKCLIRVISSLCEHERVYLSTDIDGLATTHVD